MTYISLGNMKRFLNKLKDYLSNNYLQLSGGTVTGNVSFSRDIEANRVRLRSVAEPITLISNDDGNMAKEQDGKFYAFLDEKNYAEYVPKLDGTGATGTWAINISGNALNDSEGNKIVDTYAKKSETSTAPDLTKYMKKSADSSLDMKEHPIYFGYAQISLNDGFVIDGTGDKVKILGTSLFFNNSRIDTREYNQKLYAPQVSPTFTGTVTAPNVIVSTSLTIPGGKIWIA